MTDTAICLLCFGVPFLAVVFRREQIEHRKAQKACRRLTQSGRTDGSRPAA